MKYTKKSKGSKRSITQKVGGWFWSKKKKKVGNPADIFFQHEEPISSPVVENSDEHKKKDTIQKLKNNIQMLRLLFCLQPTKYFDIILINALEGLERMKNTNAEEEKSVGEFLLMDINEVLKYTEQFEKCEKIRKKRPWNHKSANSWDDYIKNKVKNCHEDNCTNFSNYGMELLFNNKEIYKMDVNVLDKLASIYFNIYKECVEFIVENNKTNIRLKETLPYSLT